MKDLLETCVDSVESALYAQKGGADRLELCANLIIGGTSPSGPFIREVLKAVQIPVNVLLRPRFGDFCYTPAEKRMLLAEIEDCRSLGVNGVVIGALTPTGELDEPFLKECMQAAGPLKVTLHRAFDLTKDAKAALETAVSLGFDTVLTSGQQASAEKGADLLAQLVEQAAGRIHILAGSGVGPANIRLLAEKGLTQFHCSGKRSEEGPMKYRRQGVPMGLPVADEYQRTYTDESTVRAVKNILQQLEA